LANKADESLFAADKLLHPDATLYRFPEKSSGEATDQPRELVHNTEGDLK
jgi:hypothetical protein